MERASGLWTGLGLDFESLCCQSAVYSSETLEPVEVRLKEIVCVQPFFHVRMLAVGPLLLLASLHNQYISQSFGGKVVNYAQVHEKPQYCSFNALHAVPLQYMPSPCTNNDVVATCDGIGLSMQHSFLTAAYLSSREVGKMMTTS